jgi:putative DNA primase/helicase
MEVETMPDVGKFGVETEAIQGAPAKDFVATHEWRSEHYDWPCSLTGEAWHHAGTGQDYVVVITEDGTTTPVPKDQVFAKGPKKPPQPLSAADAERLNSWMLEIADEALGNRHDEGDGSIRFGSNRGLVIHRGGFFFDFVTSTRGAGGLELLAHLHRLSGDPLIAKAREWLDAHPGVGSQTEEAEDGETRQAEDDAERSAFIAEIWERAVEIRGTPGWEYLTSARALTPSDADLTDIRWLPQARGWGAGAEGALVAALRNNTGGLEALQYTYITATGAKSALEPCRRTHRGVHDWGGRGLLRLGAADNPKAYLVEGLEDGLSLRQADPEARVLVPCGLYRLGKPELPFNTETVAVVRDADAPEGPATVALWKGVVRLACQMHGQGEVLVTTRPDAVRPSEPQRPIKDANDLLRHHGVAAVKALMASAHKAPPFPEVERKAIVEAASDVDNAAYASGRERLAVLVSWRKADLDKARQHRIAERAHAPEAQLAERDTSWPDPVLDVAPLLDEIVREVARYVVAPTPMLHTVALWISVTHLVHRKDLKINISPRLAIQAPDKNCGKSVLMEALACGVPRPDMVTSTSASAIFRSVHADRNTLLIDEMDLLLKGGRNPELHQVLNGGYRRSTAKVKRVERLPNGSFDPTSYNCFTGVAMAGIKELPGTLQDRSILVFLQRAMAGEVKEHLVDAESEALITVRRKLARWAEDLRELPAVDRPRELANRKGDNWYPLRQIAVLAGGEWPARVWKAAVGPSAAPTPSGGALTELLDAIWRVFRASQQPRMLTSEIVAALLDLDEGKWRQIKSGGKAVDEYYLRDHLKDVIPRLKEANKKRRWKPRGHSNPQYGYTIQDHLKEPFLRYLGRKSPLAEGAEEIGQVGGDEEEEELADEELEAQVEPARQAAPPEAPEPFAASAEASSASAQAAEKPETGLPRGARNRGRPKP